MLIEKRLEELGITLPPPEGPVANYLAQMEADGLLFLSGSGPVENGKAVMTGKVGGELTLEQGREAARMGALSQISRLKAYLGDLDRVEQIVKLLGFVACPSDFYDQPKVINGASDLLVEVFGDRGRHARSAVAAPSLPMNTPVEIELVVKIKS